MSCHLKVFSGLFLNIYNRKEMRPCGDSGNRSISFKELKVQAITGTHLPCEDAQKWKAEVNA